MLLFVLGKEIYLNFWAPFQILLTCIFGLFSAFVFLGEITLYLDMNLTVFGYSCSTFFVTQVLYSFALIISQLSSLLPLLYITFAVYFSLFSMKISGFYGLYNHHQSDAASLLFFSINFLRCGTPLCYNFLQMAKITDASFSKIMGELNLVPLFGTNFPRFFPIILIILCLMTLFDVYGRLLSGIGLKQFKFSTKFSDEAIFEGKKLITQGLVQSTYILLYFLLARQSQNLLVSSRNKFMSLAETELNSGHRKNIDIVNSDVGFSKKNKKGFFKMP